MLPARNPAYHLRQVHKNLAILGLNVVPGTWKMRKRIEVPIPWSPCCCLCYLATHFVRSPTLFNESCLLLWSQLFCLNICVIPFENKKLGSQSVLVRLSISHCTFFVTSNCFKNGRWFSSQFLLEHSSFCFTYSWCEYPSLQVHCSGSHSPGLWFATGEDAWGECKARFGQHKGARPPSG